MPRQPRIDLPHFPQHVLQRGNDRRPCFFHPIDHMRYLDELRDITGRLGCAVHAYVLMTNHVHLLLTPSAAGQVAAVMQALGRRYVRYVKDRYHRTGTLWEGRYRPARSTAKPTCCAATATSSSTRYARRWFQPPPTIAGPATPPTPTARTTR